jgi:PhnB protein
MAKAKSAAPKGYNTVTTYLTVKGAGDVLAFMKKAFGATVSEKHVNDDGTIMHAEAKIGDTRIMLGEACQSGPMPAMLYMYVPNCDAVYKKAIKAGAKSVMPPTDQFYGDRSGGVQDKAGNQWWIATRKEKVSKAELKKRAKAKARKK